MNYSKVSARWQTVIPRQIRDEMGIKPNTRLSWSTDNGVIIVIPISEDPAAASFGILAGKGFTLDDFLRERQEDRELERRREARLDAQVRRALRKR